MRRAPVLVCTLFAFVLVGCDLSSDPPEIDEDIEAFVASESLPEAQDPAVVFADSKADVTAFRVRFGPGCDCPSGCIYSSAYGLQFRNRVGWMRVRQYFCLEDSVDVSGRYFDLRPRHSTLFSTDFRERFREAATTDEENDVQAHIYEVFLDMLATDEDTPTETLLSLAQRLQETYRPGVGLHLLETPVVRSSRPILEVLAQLPDSGGYRAVRDRAQALLDELDDESYLRGVVHSLAKGRL